MKWLAIYRNLARDVIVRLPHLRIGDNQWQETFLAPSAYKQTRNYDIECSNHHRFLSTLRLKKLSQSKMKWWAIYKNIPVGVIIRLRHPRSGERKWKETFLAPSADRQTHNYDIECSNQYPSLSTLRPKGLSHSKTKWWAAHTNISVDAIVRPLHSRSGDRQNQETFLAWSVEK